MSSEAIAKVIRDIKMGRALDPAYQAVPLQDDPSIVENLKDVHKSLVQLTTDFPMAVIDATPMYHQIVSGPEINLYDDYRVMPVWQNAMIGYENEWGNVWVIQMYVIDKKEHYWEPNEWMNETKPPYEWQTPNPVDWEAVRYRFIGVLWGGGMTKGKHVETVGPLYRWDIASYEDGTMADIRWTALYEFGDRGTATHQNSMMIWLQTLTLAGCTNVELVTPQRSKPERKRLARLGVEPQAIVIKKTSKSYRYHKDDTQDTIGGVPQRFVRGHFAHYGPEFDRGLLFGKYAGKFWIPARAVGDSEYVTGE